MQRNPKVMGPLRGMAVPNQLAMELEKAASLLPVLYCLLPGPAGGTVVLHQPSLLPGKAVLGERTPGTGPGAWE